MKASNSLWREPLLAETPPELIREIDIFEAEIELRKQGKLDEKLFAETRLRRGAYGQRYDNDYAFVIHFREGKIARYEEYCDTELIARVLPERGAAKAMRKPG